MSNTARWTILNYNIAIYCNAAGTDNTTHIIEIRIYFRKLSMIYKYKSLFG